jgi:hypothetical protein
MFRPQKTLKKTRIIQHTSPEAKQAISAAAEMKYMGKTEGYTWTDYKTNTEIANKLNITPVLDKIQDTEENGYEI